MAENLLTLGDLSVWARTDINDSDEWAVAVLEAASDVVRTAAGQPTWTRVTAPPRARQIASHLAARTYLNPDSIQSEGGLGPLGGDRFVEELATALHLTAAERAELAGMSAASSGPGGGSLWVLPINATQVDGATIHLADDSGSDWMIPYLDEGYDPAALG